MGQSESNDFGFALEAEASNDFRGALAEVAGSSGDFPFLLQRASRKFDLRSDSGFIVVLAFESEAEPVVAVAADIFQKYGREIILRDQQPDGAVAIEIKSHDAARIMEDDFVESGFSGDVAKA